MQSVACLRRIFRRYVIEQLDSVYDLRSQCRNVSEKEKERKKNNQIISICWRNDVGRLLFTLTLLDGNWNVCNFSVAYSGDTRTILKNTWPWRRCKLLSINWRMGNRQLSLTIMWTVNADALRNKRKNIKENHINDTWYGAKWCETTKRALRTYVVGIVL